MLQFRNVLWMKKVAQVVRAIKTTQIAGRTMVVEAVVAAVAMVVRVVAAVALVVRTMVAEAAVAAVAMACGYTSVPIFR